MSVKAIKEIRKQASKIEQSLVEAAGMAYMLEKYLAELEKQEHAIENLKSNAL